MNNKNISVLIYEDKTFLRDGLKLLIGGTPGFECAGAFANCNEVVKDIHQLKPDVVLLDIEMPGINGIEAVEKIRKVYAELPLLMQTVFEENEKIFQSICAGANGYILKNTPPAEMLEAIKTVYNGGAPMSPAVAARVLQMFRNRNFNEQAVKEDYQLTEREKNILQQLVDGNTTKQIASIFNISVDTVRFHFKNIYQKLHVNTQAEAVAKTLKERIV
ncbi:MAG TPA: response regulator transcription factor [Bacteroidia bacterium]|jgi:DNA-binding NarL/FixJ family response regulator|nr:response regulator transcription factor [Bacteroidia bacterium]HNU33686.1 response regulator transcription factor [Bacteroidia bacterium]